jgi:hypothetical protein
MIAVVMNQEGVDLQTAVDFVGDMCKQSIDRFQEERSRLPSWGPEIDRDVAIYVEGLADWIVGSLHWSFETERYFGKNGRQVKASRVIELLPRRKSSASVPVVSTIPPSLFFFLFCRHARSLASILYSDINISALSLPHYD